MNLTKIKDCKNCNRAIVKCSIESIDVECSSSDYSHKEKFKRMGRQSANSCDGYDTTDCKNRVGLIKKEAQLQFILAGKSSFTMHSTITNEDFTYKVDKVKDDEDKYYVSIIGNGIVTYAGIMRLNRDTNKFEYKRGNKGNVNITDISIKSLIFILNKLIIGQKTDSLELYHNCLCPVCGYKISDDSEIETGYHKKCYSIIYDNSIFEF